MATTRPRPYRRILTSVLHRRFVHASALALLVDYAIAFVIGTKTSCEFPGRTSVLCRADLRSSFVVMVSLWVVRFSRNPFVSFQLDDIYPPRWPDACRFSNDDVAVCDFPVRLSSAHHSDAGMVYSFGLVI